MSLGRHVKMEWVKLFRRRATYVGYGAITGFCGLVLTGFLLGEHRYTRRRLGGTLGFDDGAIEAIINSAPFFASQALTYATWVLIPIFVCMIAGYQMAGEARDGTLRGIMLRPPGRVSMVTSKLLMSWVYTFSLLYAFLGIALFLGIAAYPWNDLMIIDWQLIRRGIFKVWEGWEIGAVLFVQVTGYAIGLCTLATITFFISTLTENPVAATIWGLSLYFISRIMDRIEMIDEWMRDFLFTKHIEFGRYATLYGSEGYEQDVIVNDLLWCVGYSAIFALLSYLVVMRKDITS